MREIDKLKIMLEEAKIDFDYSEERRFGEFSEYDRYSRIKIPNKRSWRVSVIFGYGTYGYDEELLEAWSKTAKDRNEDPDGYLTAEQVFEMVKEELSIIRGRESNEACGG